MKSYWHCCLLVSSLVVIGINPAYAQSGSYPGKPVQIIVDSPAGSTPDVAIRIVAATLSKAWNQQVLIVNRPGGGGSVAARAAAEAVPDGYTLYHPVSAAFVSLPSSAPNLPVHVPRDFLPIGFVSANPMFIATSPSSGIASVADIVARAKANPGQLSYASTGVGRLSHLAGELLQLRAGIKLLLVPYTGGIAASIGDVVTGRVNMIIEPYPGLAGAIGSGQLKLVATASPKRLAEFPEVPAIAESVPDFQAVGWTVMLAPPGTPAAVISKVSADLRNAILQQDVQQGLAKLGSYSQAMTVAEVTDFVQGQQKLWQPILDEIGKQQKAN